MKTIPYRCDETRHKALLGAARYSGMSVQRLFDNFVTHIIADSIVRTDDLLCQLVVEFFIKLTLDSASEYKASYV